MHCAADAPRGGATFRRRPQPHIYERGYPCRSATSSTGRPAGSATLPAITCGDRSLSFAEFDDATDRVGNALLARGLMPGDRVAVLLPNGIEGLIAYYALAKSGLVRVSMNVRDTAETTTFVCGLRLSGIDQ